MAGFGFDAGSKGFLGGDKIQATMVFEKVL